jgi:glycerophosphoryl diester phosphodiesterase
MARRFLIFGHRGCPKGHPENSIESFEAALRAGADGFETDLRLLSDGSVVLFHDDELEGEPVESLTAARCAASGRKLARLDELAPFAARTTMILEVKRGGWPGSLLAAVEGWPDVVVASFDHRLIAELSERGAAVALGLTLVGAVVDLASYAEALGASWVFPAFRYADRQMVDELHARDVRCVPWTPNREREWEQLREIGCDGVITDFPAEAVGWRERQSAR